MSRKSFVIPVAFSFVLCLSIWCILQNDEGSAPKSFDQIQKEGVIRFVTDYNPVGYYVSGDTIAGFNYELIQLLKQYTQLSVEVFLESNLDKSIEGIGKGKYDVLAQSIPITSKLREELRFTESIAQNRQVLIQRKKEYNQGKELIKSQLDLAKKTLYVPSNSPAILRIKNLSHEIGDSIFIEENESYGVEQLIMLVASGEIDYAVCDEETAEVVAETISEIDYSTLIGFTHFEAWAVDERSLTLLDSLNSWINRLKQTQEYENIYKKYYK